MALVYKPGFCELRAWLELREVELIMITKGLTLKLPDNHSAVHEMIATWSICWRTLPFREDFDVQHLDSRLRLRINY